MKMYAHIAFKKKKIFYQSLGKIWRQVVLLLYNLQYCILSIEYEWKRRC